MIGTFDRIVRAAEKDCRLACYRVGTALLEGDGVERNPKEAIRWLERAASLGLLLAHETLGHCFRDGIGVPVDLQQAVRHFEKAAIEKGLGLTELACHYVFGLGVEPDRQRAIELYGQAADPGDFRAACWEAYFRAIDTLPSHNATVNFERLVAAAHQQNPDAAFAAGLWVASGFGTEPDETAPIAWWTVAAQQDHPGAHFMLGRALVAGVGIEPDQQVGIEHLMAAANPGHARAQREIGNLYVRSVFLPRDLAAGEHWLRMAGEADHPVAKTEWVGLVMARTGQDAALLDRIIDWCEQAAMAGNPEGSSYLADISMAKLSPERVHPHSFTHHIIQVAESGHQGAAMWCARTFMNPDHQLDRDTGIFWLQVAGERMSVEALCGLASELLEGKRVTRDPLAAMATLEMASSIGSPEARFMLGRLLLEGDGPIMRNKPIAANLFRAAAEQGHAGAQWCLGVMCQYGDGIPRDPDQAAHWIGMSRAQQPDEPEDDRLATVIPFGRSS